MSRRKSRNYTNELKQQMVQLYNSGKPFNEIIKVSDLTASHFIHGVKNIVKQVLLKLLTI